MPHMKCSKCGKSLTFPHIDKPRLARCPSCGHVFQLLPVDSSVPSADATPPPLPTSRTETDDSTDKVGVSTKIIVSAFGLVGVVLIAVLVTVLVRGAGPSKPDDAKAHYNMGTAYAKNGQYAEVITAYKSAIAIKPDDAEAYHNMGVAYENMGQYAEAITAYKSAIAIKPDLDVAYVGMVLAYNSMGSAYEEMGRYAEAITAYKSAIAIKPDYAVAYLGMGNMYIKMGRYAEAITAFERAAQLDPTGKAGQAARKGLRILRRRP